MSEERKVQIGLCERLFRKAHERAKRAGLTTSEWLRQLLRAWDGQSVDQPVKQLSVRLDRPHARRLDKLARKSGKSRSRAFALLIESALEDSFERLRRPSWATADQSEPDDSDP